MARTVTRTLAAVAVVGLTTLGMSGTPADAGVGCKPIKGKPAYPPGQCKPKSINPDIAAPGDTVTATSGEGQFTAGSSVQVVLQGPKGTTLGSVIANSRGEAVLTFKVPAGTTPGAYTVTFTGRFFGSANALSLKLQVVKALAGQGSGAGNGNVAGNGSGLPFTGFELGMASVLGLGLIGGGTGVLVACRRRRDPATT